jgi:hypothetical protein
MSLTGMLRSGGVLQRAASTKDSSGGAVKGTWEDVSEETVACDIQPVGSGIRLQYMKLQMTVTHSIFVASDVGARAGDRWRSGDRYFLVQGYTPPAPGYSQWPGRIDGEEQPQIEA